MMMVQQFTCFDPGPIGAPAGPWLGQQEQGCGAEKERARFAHVLSRGCSRFRPWVSIGASAGPGLGGQNKGGEPKKNVRDLKFAHVLFRGCLK